MRNQELSPELWEKSHERDWWETWRNNDYSWEGLANKDYRGYSITPEGTLLESAIAPSGSRQATLQDYWRDEEHNLIAEKGREGTPGKQWTRFHLPTNFRDGSPTGKSSWADAEWCPIEDKLKVLLSRAQENSPGTKEDHRAQFQGVILRKLPSLTDTPLNVNADSARFLTDHDFSDYVFGPDLDLQWAAFAGTTSWKRTKFGSSANFSHAQFAGSASFEATFTGTTWFLNTVFGGLEVSFTRTTFAYAHFSNAHFFAAAKFVNAKLGEAQFSDARFWNRASFDGTQFIGRANFDRTIFGRENVPQTESTFSKAMFFGPALFDYAIFHSESVFTAARFDDKADAISKRIVKLHRFEDSKLRFDVHFDYAQFHRRANFENAVFSSDVTFDGTDFSEAAEFDYSTFSGTTSFKSTRFDRTRLVSFRSANFRKPARFEKVRWPIDPQAHAGAFRDAKLPRLAEFSQDDSFPFTAFAMFDGTRFEGEVRLSREILKGDRGMKAAFSAAADNDDFLRALENGCRALKLGSENLGDRLAEQTFYRYELSCRRAQKTTDRPERFVSWIYDIVSKYGTSILRPLGVLSGVWLSFSIVYWIIAFAMPQSPIHGVTVKLFAPIHASVIESFRLSAHVIFAPFAIWSGDFGVTAFDKALFSAKPAVALGVRLVATLESVFAAVLIFLTLLSLRRRFKID